MGTRNHSRLGNALRRRSHAGEVEGRVPEEEESLGEVGRGCSEKEEPFRGSGGSLEEGGGGVPRMPS